MSDDVEQDGKAILSVEYRETAWVLRSTLCIVTPTRACVVVDFNGFTEVRGVLLEVFEFLQAASVCGWEYTNDEPVREFQTTVSCTYGDEPSGFVGAYDVRTHGFSGV